MLRGTAALCGISAKASRPSAGPQLASTLRALWRWKTLPGGSAMSIIGVGNTQDSLNALGLNGISSSGISLSDDPYSVLESRESSAANISTAASVLSSLSSLQKTNNTEFKRWPAKSPQVCTMPPRIPPPARWSLTSWRSWPRNSPTRPPRAACPACPPAAARQPQRLQLQQQRIAPNRPRRQLRLRRVQHGQFHRVQQTQLRADGRIASGNGPGGGKKTDTTPITAARAVANPTEE